MGFGQIYCSICLCIIITIVLIIASFFIALIFYPSTEKFYLENASLAQFDLNNTTKTLHYNLKLDISVRNPNRRSGLCFNQIRVVVFFMRNRLGMIPLTRFCQGHKSTVLIHPVFVGQSVLELAESQVAEYWRERAQGFFYFDVGIHARVSSKIGSVKTRPFSSDIGCKLRVPLVPSNSSIGVVFTRIGCDVEYPDDGD